MIQHCERVLRDNRSTDSTPRPREGRNLLKALSSRDRLLLLYCLADGEQRAPELLVLSGLGRPALSRQLGLLRRYGMVTARLDGKLTFYSIKDPETVCLLDALSGIFQPAYTREATVSRPAADCRIA